MSVDVDIKLLWDSHNKAEIEDGCYYEIVGINDSGHAEWALFDGNGKELRCSPSWYYGIDSAKYEAQHDYVYDDQSLKARAMSLLSDAIDGYVFDSDWESFKEMIEVDRSDLRYILELIEGDDAHALKVARNLDTAPREEIPHSTWKYMESIQEA